MPTKKYLGILHDYEIFASDKFSDEGESGCSANFAGMRYVFKTDILLIVSYLPRILNSSENRILANYNPDAGTQIRNACWNESQILFRPLEFRCRISS